MTPKDYQDKPFDVIAAQVEELAKKGALCFQKFTCGGCGNRLLIDRPNVLYTTGKCDKCNHVTDIKAAGCGYALIMSYGGQQ